MTDFTVTFLDSNNYHVAKKKYKVKHFRQYAGNAISANGGYTCLFDLENGHVLVSKCRNDEQFSRRKGILTCLQKYLNNEGIPSNEKVIDSIQPAVDGMIIRLSKSHQKMFWWL